MGLERQESKNLSSEEKEKKLLEEEVGSIFSQINSIKKKLDGEKIEKIKVLRDDPNFGNQVFFILGLLEKTREKISDWMGDGREIAKSCEMLDRISNFGNMICLSFVRFDKNFENGKEPDENSAEVVILKKQVNGLFDYLKELEDDSKFEDEIQKSWGREEAA